jgi:RNase H-like domain found in reverse transcriptase
MAPNKKEPFKLESNALSYIIGAALFQRDKREKRKAIEYASETLNEAKKNYNIWNQEFLGLIFKLTY